MAIQRMDHVSVVVDDLSAATKFFTALGLKVRGEGTIEGSVVDRIVALEDVLVQMVMVETPDGHGCLELVRFDRPAAREGDGHAPANTLGIRHLCFQVDDIDASVDRARSLGARLVGDVEQYGDSYRLCYLRGPEGIIVELAEKLG